MELNPRQGAAALSRGEKNPTSILQGLISKHHPAISEGRILEMWREIMRSDMDYVESIELYAFKNLWMNLTRVSKTPKEFEAAKEARERSNAERDAAVKAGVVRIFSRVALTLKLKMPDGRSLSAWTGTEASILGGVFVVIGEKAGHARIGKVFTDESLQALIKE